MKLTDDQFLSLVTLMDREAQARGWSSWQAAQDHYDEGHADVTEVVTSELLTEIMVPPPLVWLTRKTVRSGGDTLQRVLVNLDHVDAVVPNMDGCTVYWMSGQTAWDIAESMEEVHDLMLEGRS